MENGSSSARASLAITEKRKMVHPKTPVGCISIFFQFFARRKLFSRKLLTHVRPANKAPKKLPMAKKLLIADENSGGFPRIKKVEDDGRMRAPGVVAKLMGLDSVPVVRREKPKESSQSHVDGIRNEASQELSVANPQKMQNVDKFSDSKASGIGRGVRSDLSKSKTYHHKFVSPAKSPRSLSGMNKAQLLEAATKILNHGSGSGDQPARSFTVSEEASNGSLCSSCRNSGEIVELRLSGKEAERTDQENTKKNAHVKSKLQNKAALLHPVQAKGTARNAPIISNNRGRTASLVIQDKSNLQNRARDSVEAKTHVRNTQHKNMPQKNASSNSALKQNNLKQNQLYSVNKEAVPKPVVRSNQLRIRDQNATNGAKNFVSLNKNLSYCADLRSKIEVSDRMDRVKGSLENKNIIRKRWSDNDLQNENAGILRLKFAVERTVGKELIKGKGAGLVSKKPISQNHARSDSGKQAELDMEERRGIRETAGGGSHPKVMPSDAARQNLTSLKGTTYTPKASSQQNRNGWTYRADLMDRPKFDRRSLPGSRKDDAKTGKSAALRARDSDHPKPISLLETSFRHDCPSGSSNRSAGGKPFTYLKESSRSKSSASLVNIRKLAAESNPYSTISNTTRHDASTFELAIQESKLRYSEEVVLNAELLLENISYFRSERTKSSSLAVFLHETMEAILDAFCISTRCTFSFAKTTEGNLLRNLVLDFIIEFLASLYSRYCNFGYNSWLKVLLFCIKDRLVAEIEKEMKSWYPMIGKAIEDLVEKDFDKSTEIWIDFSTKAFQIGMQIEDDILQILIDEVVLDLSRG
ncbi:uncharacterized protein [Typha latifolia]|uniref:uncharacterized protein n=1 Tax=Typha latifolia TaxID=4733 RepID=UPI003C2C8689